MKKLSLLVIGLCFAAKLFSAPQSSPWTETTNAVEARAALGLANALTNVAFTNFNLGNDAWRTARASKLTENDNVGRYLWKNTRDKIARGDTVAILENGTGLAAYSPGAICVPYSLTNGFEIVGCMTPYPPFWQVGGSSSIGSIASGGTNWLMQWNALTNAVGWKSWFSPPGTGLKWNVLEVDYIIHPLGGNIAVLTNGQGGANPNLLTTLDANGSFSGATYRWTNTAITDGGCLITNMTGTNYLLNVGAYNNSRKGLIIGRHASGDSLGILNIRSVSTNVITPIFRSWAPDLMIIQSLEGTNVSFTTNWWPLMSYYTNILPKTDYVWSGTYPVLDLPLFNIPGQNQWIRSNALVFGCSFFDMWKPFQNTNIAMTRGLMLNPDNVHYAAEGMFSAGYFLSRWLDLNEPAEPSVIGFGCLSQTAQEDIDLLEDIYTNTWTFDHILIGGDIKAGTSSLTNTYPGKYRIGITASFSGAANDSFECAVFTNGVECTLIEWVRNVGNNAIGSAAAESILSLPANCRVEMKIQNTAQAGTITSRKASLVMTRAN